MRTASNLSVFSAVIILGMACKPDGVDLGSDWSTDNSSNPIEVPESLLADALNSGSVRCEGVDLQSVKPLSNPGFGAESLGLERISGNDFWKVSFYTMLYSNCERQARGLKPFKMYSAEKQVAMQETVRGISESHGGFGQRADIDGGVCAEGHGGGPFYGAEMRYDDDLSEDDDGNGLWSHHEVGRRAAIGLVNHGDAMTSHDFECVFAGASLGPTADEWLDIIIFYGNGCL